MIYFTSSNTVFFKKANEFENEEIKDRVPLPYFLLYISFSLHLSIPKHVSSFFGISFSISLHKFQHLDISHEEKVIENGSAMCNEVMMLNHKPCTSLNTGGIGMPENGKSRPVKGHG